MRRKRNLLPTIRAEMMGVMTHLHTIWQESTNNASEEATTDGGHAVKD